jgi:SHS2 domain-containing protein
MERSVSIAESRTGSAQQDLMRPSQAPGASGWEHFPHGADIGVHGWGGDAAESFERAAIALTAIVVDPSSVNRKTSIEITCNATTLEDLLVEWLNSVIFEMAARRLVFGAFEVVLTDTRLSATACGELLDPDRHEPAVEPKGATYTALRVVQTADGRWDAQCVVDV